jgi:preprotein translocase subunit SecG
LFLMLLVLVQLPKKEAGLGQAFGSGTTDALFGAGSGNALTKLTKYATGIFFVLTLSLSVLHGHQAKGKRSGLESALQEANKVESAAPAKPAPVTPGAVPAVTPATTNLLMSAPTNTAGATQAPANPPTTAPVEKDK